MRWILIILLMLNGIYYIWQQSAQPSADAGLASRWESIQGADSLVLLSEMEPSVKHVEEATVAPPVNLVEEAAVPVAKPAICWLIGPFKEELTVKQVISRMETLDITMSFQEVVAQGKPDYWVYIAPQSSRQAAITLHKELLAKKIDSFRIRDGDLRDGISLGLFKSKERAENVRKQRSLQGYDVDILLVPRPYTRLWAVFDTEKYGEFSDQLWDKMKEGNKGLERHKNYCDKIDSIDNLE